MRLRVRRREVSRLFKGAPRCLLITVLIFGEAEGEPQIVISWPELDRATKIFKGLQIAIALLKDNPANIMSFSIARRKRNGAISGSDLVCFRRILSERAGHAGARRLPGRPGQKKRGQQRNYDTFDC